MIFTIEETLKAEFNLEKNEIASSMNRIVLKHTPERMNWLLSNHKNPSLISVKSFAGITCIEILKKERFN